jgi:hypothetical protein
LGMDGMDQYLLIPFLGGWTSIYQLFWCSPGVQGFDTLPLEPNILFCSRKPSILCSFQVALFQLSAEGKLSQRSDLQLAEAW